MRTYTALKDGQVVSRGTFHDEELIKLDFPEPAYTLKLDVYEEFNRPQESYQDLRRMAYPPLSDLADAMYWQTKGDDSKMDAYNAKIEAVKALYPKV